MSTLCGGYQSRLHTEDMSWNVGTTFSWITRPMGQRAETPNDLMQHGRQYYQLLCRSTLLTAAVTTATFPVANTVSRAAMLLLLLVPVPSPRPTLVVRT